MSNSPKKVPFSVNYSRSTKSCRAGIHCGPVIVGEMGDYKREIAFLGDTVNTTARIQEAGKEYKSDLLVSSEFLKKLSLACDCKVERIGEIRLKGKEISVELFGIEKARGVLLSGLHS